MSSARGAKVVELEPKMDRDDEPLIAGQLRAFPIANVIQFLGSSRVTGTLSVSFGDRRAFVCLEEGMIVAASSARLPRRSPRKVNEVIDPETAEEELLTRACDVLSRAMAWPQGQFSFRVSQDRIRRVTDADTRPRLQPERVLMQAAFSMDEECRVG